MVHGIPIPAVALVAVVLIGLPAGCRAQADRIPGGAVLMASQSGGMGFLARGNGTVYLQDSQTGQIVYASPVGFGDKLAFLPQQKQVLFNGNVISQPDLNERHVYRLYFLRE